MTNHFLKNIRGKVLRITKLDACGNVVTGATSSVVSDGFVKVDLKAQVESPTDYKVKNANDALVINAQGDPFIRWWDVTVDFIGVDPYIYNLIAGMPLVMNDAATPEAIGILARSGPVKNAFALEVWTDLDGQPCDATGAKRYGYFVVPFIVNGVIGDVTVENGPISFPITGARTSDNPGWGTGPYNVLKTAAGADSKLLTPMGSLDHYQMFMTSMAPPVASVGPLAVPAAG